MAWQFDPYHLQVEFAVKHFGMMTVRGNFTENLIGGLSMHLAGGLTLRLAFHVCGPV